MFMPHDIHQAPSYQANTMSTELDVLKTKVRVHHHTLEGDYVLSTGRSTALSAGDKSLTTAICTQGNALFHRYHNRVGGPVLAHAPLKHDPLPEDDPAAVAWKEGLRAEAWQLYREAEKTGLVGYGAPYLTRRVSTTAGGPTCYTTAEHNTIVLDSKDPEPDILAGERPQPEDGWLGLANKMKQAAPTEGSTRSTLRYASRKPCG